MTERAWEWVRMRVMMIASPGGEECKSAERTKGWAAAHGVWDSLTPAERLTTGDLFARLALDEIRAMLDARQKEAASGTQPGAAQGQQAE